MSIKAKLKSSIFGQNIIYCNKVEISYRLSDLVINNGFSDFDSKGITSFLTFRYPIGDLTMFKEYMKIPCGFELENEKIYKYWYPKFKNGNKISFDEACEKVENMLLKSIKYFSQSKKISIMLSGGLDSSLILAMCRKLFPNQEIYTYCAGFYGDDEFEYSRLVAKEFKAIYKEKILYKEDYIGENSLLKPLILYKGEPLHPNEIALANIEKIAKEDGCEIVICGEGADDIFGGYGQNLRMYMNYKGNQPFFKYFLNNYRYFTLEDRKRIIKDKYLTDDLELLNCYLDKEEMPVDIQDKIFYFIQKIHTIGLIIRGTNAIKFNKLEPAFPYLDLDLVNFVNSLPFDYKVHWKSEKHKKKSNNMFFRNISEKMDVPKYILKKIAEKYLPFEIIYRPKKGFPVPFDKWFTNLKEWPLHKDIFKSTDLSSFNGWKKFMIINLDTFIRLFSNYKK